MGRLNKAENVVYKYNEEVTLSYNPRERERLMDATCSTSKVVGWKWKK